MPPFRRVGRPGLIGTAARTAVIAGTATAVSGGVARRQAGRAQASYEQQQYEAAEQQRQIEEAARQAAAQQAAAAPAIAAPAPAGGDDIIAKLNQLAQLQAAGVLSADEFAAAKAKLLA